MKKRLLVLIVALFFQPLSSLCAEIPEALKPMITQAMKAGTALYEAYLRGPATNVEIERLRSKIDDFCEFQYNAYVVDGNTYFIAEHPTIAGGIVYGRHYKVSENGIAKSTVACVVCDPPAENTVAATVTHLLSESPTEFHVFLSLKHKYPIYVITSVGVWKIEGGCIAYVRKLEGPPELSDETTESHVPIWKRKLLIWPDHYKTEKPWRLDSRLKEHFKEKFPDDLPVVFANFDKTQRPEVMWVTVIGYDPPRDLFLGILLNEPYHMSDPSEGDTIVFRFDRATQKPVAVAEKGSYRLKARPVTCDPKFLDAVLDGVRAYRQGRFGHNMPRIEKGIEILSSAVANVPPCASPEERFAAHFGLARCLAEKYDTARAIEQFGAAIAINPDDLDAQMGLLCELTLMVRKRIDKPWPADQAEWDKAYLDQMSVVKSRFGGTKTVQEAFYYLFKEPDPDKPPTLAKEDMERGRKFGFSTFRWKMK